MHTEEQHTIEMVFECEKKGKTQHDLKIPYILPRINCFTTIKTKEIDKMTEIERRRERHKRKKGNL